MYSRQLLRLLLVVALVVCVAQASWWDIRHRGRPALVGRQDSSSGDDGNTPTATPTDSQQKPTSSDENTSPTAAQPSETAPSSTPKEPTSSSTPQPQPTSSSPPSQTPTPSSSAENPPPSSSPVEEPTPTSENNNNQPTNDPASSTVVEVVTSSTSDGGTEGSASTTPTAESTPGLNTDKSSSTSGLSPKTRNTVIGVVVGIGGAIVLGALGVVAWRIWGRKKHSEESDGLMDYNMGTGGLEKQEPTGSLTTSNQRTPFQSTLENYHQPNQVNASSNF